MLLRLILGDRGALAEWRSIKHGIASALVEVECLRTIDRLHQQGKLPLPQIASRRSAVYDLIEEVEVVPLSEPVLRRAAQPFPVPLGTLDALHLATALLWTERRGGALVMATHDASLATASRACGLDVVGM